MLTGTTQVEVPLTPGRRADLVEDLITWSLDPNPEGFDRGLVDNDDPYENDGYAP